MNRYSDTIGEGACLTDSVDAGAVRRAADAVASEPLTVATSALFGALSDPTRLRILDALMAEELCVCDIAALTGVSQSAVSHQLRLLRDRGLVTFRREGQRAVYRLADEHVTELLRVGFEHAEERS
jgi:ArsR family transcriptional regulator